MSKPPVPTERLIQRTLVAWLRLVLPAGSMVAAVVNEQAGASSSPIARARFGAARKLSGVVSGWPDLLVTMPGGSTVWLEVKRPGGVLSLAQQDIHERLFLSDHIVMVADGIESCRYALAVVGFKLNEAPDQPKWAAKVRLEKPPI